MLDFLYVEDQLKSTDNLGRSQWIRQQLINRYQGCSINRCRRIECQIVDKMMAHNSII